MVFTRTQFFSCFVFLVRADTPTKEKYKKTIKQIIENIRDLKIFSFAFELIKNKLFSNFRLERFYSSNTERNVLQPQFNTGVIKRNHPISVFF